MLSWIKKEKRFLEGRCLSTDTKPVNSSAATLATANLPYPYDKMGVPNGASLLEMDTGKTVYYDADGGEWVPDSSNA